MPFHTIFKRKYMQGIHSFISTSSMKVSSSCPFTIKSNLNSVPHLALQDVEVKNYFLDFLAKFCSIGSNGSWGCGVERFNERFHLTEQYRVSLHFRFQFKKEGNLDATHFFLFCTSNFHVIDWNQKLTHCTAFSVKLINKAYVKKGQNLLSFERLKCNG